MGTAFATELCKHLLAQPLSWHCITMKDYAFHAEKEHRMAIIGLPDHFAGDSAPKTRRSGETQIPYIPYKFDPKTCIAGIVVGPLAPPYAEAEARDMLDGAGITNGYVRRSDVPLRAFSVKAAL